MEDFFPWRRWTGFHASSRGLIPCPTTSLNPPVCMCAVTRGDSYGGNFRLRNYIDAGNRQRSPSYGRDWGRNDSRGNYDPCD